MPKNRIEILRLVIENNYITRKELTQKVGIASSANPKTFGSISDEGYIKREGKTKSSYWVILKQIESSVHKE